MGCPSMHPMHAQQRVPHGVAAEDDENNGYDDKNHDP